MQTNLLNNNYFQEISELKGDKEKGVSRQLVLQFDLQPKTTSDTNNLDLKVAFRPVIGQQDLLNKVKFDVLLAVNASQVPKVEGLVQFQLYFPLD